MYQLLVQLYSILMAKSAGLLDLPADRILDGVWNDYCRMAL